MYITKSSGKSPYYQILYKNDFGKFTTKSTKKKIKSDALKFLTEFKESLKEKERFIPVTLKDFEAEYLQLITSIRSKSYIRSIKTSFKRLSDFIGNPILNEVDHRDLEKFFTSIFSDSKFAAAMYYRTLKAAFEKAKGWNYISENPFKKFKLPRLPKTLPVFIDYQQLKKILEFTASELMKDVFQTAFFTGLRLGELLNLKWTAVNFKNMIIKVENSQSFTTKNKKERIVPINKTLYSILIKRYPKIIDIKLNDYVFSRIKGIPLNNFYVSKSFKKAVRKSELDERIHFHSLRHSFASGLVQKGVSIYVVKELLGHQDITTTQIYSHIQNENLFDAVRTLEPANMEKQKNVTK